MKTLECLEAAKSQVLAFSNEAVAPASLYYRRMGVRQQELYRLAASVNVEYFSVKAEGTLDTGAIDLDELIAPAYEIEALQRVEVSVPGTSGYTAGTKVTIVTLEDPLSGIPPRCRVANRKILGVNGELDLVTKIFAYYSIRPALFAVAEDGTTDLLIPSPFTELLVIDTARYAIKRIMTLPADKRAEIVKLLNDEEAGWLTAWTDHVKTFVAGAEARFGPTAALRRA